MDLRSHVVESLASAVGMSRLGPDRPPASAFGLAPAPTYRADPHPLLEREGMLRRPVYTTEGTRTPEIAHTIRRARRPHGDDCAAPLP